MRERWAQCLLNTAVSLVSMGAAFLLAEAALELAKPPDYRDLPKMRYAAARRDRLPFDQRTTLEVLEDLRAEGVPAFPPIKPFNFLTNALRIDGLDLLPLAGIAEVVTVFNANETGTRFVYRSDEYGFQNPPGLHLEEGVEIAVIGDSFAQGVAVFPGQDVASLLRKQHPRSLSLGMGASGPLIELAILREYAQPLRPRVVLWFYYEANDLSDAEKEGRNAILREYLHDSKEPSHRSLAQSLNTALTQFSEKMIADHKKSLETASTQPSRVARFLSLTSLRSRIATVASPRTDSDRRREQSSDGGGFEILRSALMKARDWTEGWGGRFVVVYLPEFARFSDTWDMHSDSLRRQQVLDFLEQEQMLVIDLLPVFRAYEDPKSLFPFSLPGHYNAKGYQKVAETIESELSANHFFQDQPSTGH